MACHSVWLTCSGNICSYSVDMPPHLMCAVYNRLLDTLWAFYEQHIKISIARWRSFVCMCSEHNVLANVLPVHSTPCKIAYSNYNRLVPMDMPHSNSMLCCTLNAHTSIRPHLVTPASLVLPQYSMGPFWLAAGCIVAQPMYYPFLQTAHRSIDKNPKK